MATNREIKFRGKRIDTGDWVYGDYFKTPLTDENSGTQSDAGWSYLTGETRHNIRGESSIVSFVIDPETVGQYTGLKDKNGKEIYEGDIVQVENVGNGVVAFGPFPTLHDSWDIPECSPKFCIKWGDSDDDCSPLREDAVVIGNIHDNPELLK